jgi:hypothetical protein
MVADEKIKTRITTIVFNIDCFRIKMEKEPALSGGRFVCGWRQVNGTRVCSLIEGIKL